MDIKKREIGKVDEVFLGIEDHGILSFNIGLDFGGSHQGTGHYNLQGPTGSYTIKKVLEFFGAREFPEIKGKTVYALYDTEGYNGSIRGFLRLPFEGGGMLIFADLFEEAKSESEKTRERMANA